MVCYTSRTYEEWRTIQKLWKAGVQTKNYSVRSPSSVAYFNIPPDLCFGNRVFIQSCIEQ